MIFQKILKYLLNGIIVR